MDKQIVEKHKMWWVKLRPIALCSTEGSELLPRYEPHRFDGYWRLENFYEDEVELLGIGGGISDGRTLPLPYAAVRDLVIDQNRTIEHQAGFGFLQLDGQAFVTDKRVWLERAR
ncbi:MAG: hypothetical protein ACREAC_30615 [Blastocatellia bacterium]